jgi:hypothetical protein
LDSRKDFHHIDHESLGTNSVNTSLKVFPGGESVISMVSPVPSPVKQVSEQVEYAGASGTTSTNEIEKAGDTLKDTAAKRNNIDVIARKRQENANMEAEDSDKNEEDNSDESESSESEANTVDYYAEGDHSDDEDEDDNPQVIPCTVLMSIMKPHVIEWWTNKASRSSASLATFPVYRSDYQKARIRFWKLQELAQKQSRAGKKKGKRGRKGDDPAGKTLSYEERQLQKMFTMQEEYKPQVETCLPTRFPTAQAGMSASVEQQDMFPAFSPSSAEMAGPAPLQPLKLKISLVKDSGGHWRSKKPQRRQSDIDSGFQGSPTYGQHTGAYTRSMSESFPNKPHDDTPGKEIFYLSSLSRKYIATK